MEKKKILNTVYFTHEQSEAVAKLSAETRIPKAVLIREGIDLLLEKYNGNKKKGKKF
jgi:hypothetical protein